MWCGVVWCGVVWCGVVWCGVVWCGVVWCGVVWCGVVWCGMVWCGVVWCGVLWFAPQPTHPNPHPILKVEEMYSTQPQKSEWFGRVATDWAWERITGYITEEKGHVVHGGDADRDDKFVAPTILYYEDMPTFVASAVAKEEIFGPVMVVIKYGDLDGVLQYINGKEKPLALYFFGSDRRVREKVLTGTTSGSVCVNDVIMQIINPELPFGGVGHSGMGHYHGKYSFDAFSHQKAVMVKPNVNILDPPIRYPPYTPFKATVLPFVQAASWLSYLPQGLALVLAFLALVLQLGFFKRRIDGALSVVQAYL